MDQQGRVAAVAALDQPVRRELYDVVAHADRWMTRDEAAAEVDLPRSVVAFHLDKLVEAGVLEVRFERTSGRSGPGAGRPSKLYRPKADEVGAWVPDRRYDLAGSLLANAVAQSAESGDPISKCVSATALAAGLEGGRDAQGCSVIEMLDRYGYEPEVEKRKEIGLTNCPFHRLAEEQRELVCGMNRDFVEGLLEGLGSSELEARLDPSPGHCCVRISKR